MTEYYFKISPRYRKIIQNFAYVFSLRGLQKVLGIFTLYFFAMTLSKEEFGEYNFILSALSICSIFTLPGLNNAIVQSHARGNQGLYKKSMVYIIAASILGSITLVGLALWSFNADNTQVAYSFIICAFLLPLSHGLVQWKCVFMGDDKYSLLFKTGTYAAIVRSIFVIFILLYFPGNIVLPVFVYLIVPAIQNIFFTFFVLKNVELNDKIEPSSIEYGIKTTLYTLPNILASQIDKILIFNILSPTALAVYVIAEKAPEACKTLFTDLGQALAPEFSKAKEYSKNMDKKLRYFSWAAGGIIVIFTFTLLPWGMIVVFGEKYSEAIPYSQALMCTIAFANIAQLRYRYILSKLDSKNIKNINLAMGLTRIAASVTLIPLFGILGAVASCFIHRVVSALVVHVIIKKDY